MDQIERITRMESILNDATEVVAQMMDAINAYSEIRDSIKELSDYYESDEWRQDLDDDEAHKLPEDLPRGVLSEDAVYSLLEDHDMMLEEMHAIVD